MITEDEARKRWCPFARAAEQQRISADDLMAPIAAVNRGSDSIRAADYQPNCLCIASDCMAWEWGEVAKLDKHGRPQTKERYVVKTVGIEGDCGLKRK